MGNRDKNETSRKVDISNRLSQVDARQDHGRFKPPARGKGLEARGNGTPGIRTIEQQVLIAAREVTNSDPEGQALI